MAKQQQNINSDQKNICSLLVHLAFHYLNYNVGILATFHLFIVVLLADTLCKVTDITLRTCTLHVISCYSSGNQTHDPGVASAVLSCLNTLVLIFLRLM